MARFNSNEKERGKDETPPGDIAGMLGNPENVGNGKKMLASISSGIVKRGGGGILPGDPLKKKCKKKKHRSSSKLDPPPALSRKAIRRSTGLAKANPQT